MTSAHTHRQMHGHTGEGGSRRALVVLGMHRSGTSAVSRVLNLCGATLPRTLMEPGPDNPKGFWESSSLSELADEVLRSAGASWDEIGSFPESWFRSELMPYYRAKMAEVLANEFDDRPFFVVKDPRLCRLTPLLHSALTESGARPSYIVPVRNPLEVAHSLKARDDFNLARGMLLWLRHVVEAEYATRNEERVFISYDNLLADWRSAIGWITDTLDINWPVASEAAEVEVDRFLTDELKNQRVPAVNLADRAEVPNHVRRVYRVLLEACSEGEVDTRALDRARRWLKDADRLYIPVVKDAELLYRGLREERDDALAAAQEKLTARDEELEETRGQLAARDEELEETRGQLAARDEELERTRGQLAAREKELEAATKQLETREREVAQLREESDRQVREIRAAEAALERARAELTAVYESRSWKVTAPARALSRAARAIVRDIGRASKFCLWLMTGQWRTSVWAVRPYYRQYVPRSIRRSIPNAVRSKLIGSPTGQGAPRGRVDGRWRDARGPLPAPEHPLISIIIVSYNKAAYTVDCIAAIGRHTQNFAYEVVLVDNGSAPEELLFLQNSLTDERLVTLNCNRGFGEGNNIGVERARGRYIVLLNNDAIVTSGWLDAMWHVLKNKDDAGCVGAKLVYPDGTLQEAGAFIQPDGDAWQRGKGGSAEAEEFNRVERVDYASAACLLVPKDLYESVLGFEYIYDPAYYEDSDFCLKLRELGYATYYCPEAEVVHYEGATSREHSFNMRLDNVVETNKHKFLGRWAERLRSGEFGDEATSPLPAAGLRQFGLAKGMHRNRPKVGVYTPFDVTPGGGERYILTLVQALASVADVELISDELWSYMRVSAVAGALGLDVARVRLGTLQQARSGGGYDCFVAMGNEVYPSAPPLGRRNIYHCQFPFPGHAVDRVTRGKWHRAYDLVIVNSKFTERNFLEQLRRENLVLVQTSVLHPPVPLVYGGAGGKSRTILHVGRFIGDGHCKKQLELVRAFKTLVSEGALAGWKLALAGGVPSEAVHREYFLRVAAEAEGWPVELHANCSTRTLNRLYRESAIYWHATGFDVDAESYPHLQEHFGVTTVEAMSAGCIPVVVDSGGQREIVSEDETGFLWADSDELRQKTKRAVAMFEEGSCEVLRSNAEARAAEYSEEQFIRQVRQLIAGGRSHGETLERAV